MSVEEVKRLDADIKGNAVLAGEFKGISDVDGLVAKANEKGYHVTAADVKTAHAELSDEDLDSAAGGDWSVIAFNQNTMLF